MLTQTCPTPHPSSSNVRWVQFNCAIKISFRLLNVLQTQIRYTSASISFGIVGVQLNGTVVVFEGSLDAVEQLLEFVREGPPRARVESIEVVDEPPVGLGEFQVR